MLLSGQDDNAGQKTGQFQLKRAGVKPQPRAENKSCRFFYIRLHLSVWSGAVLLTIARRMSAINKKSVLFRPKVSHLGSQADCSSTFSTVLYSYMVTGERPGWKGATVSNGAIGVALGDASPKPPERGDPGSRLRGDRHSPVSIQFQSKGFLWRLHAPGCGTNMVVSSIYDNPGHRGNPAAGRGRRDWTEAEIRKGRRISPREIPRVGLLASPAVTVQLAHR